MTVESMMKQGYVRYSCQSFNPLLKANLVVKANLGHLFPFFTEKVFTFLSADEVEKLKQEEERKMASLSRAELSSWSPGEDRQSEYSSHSDDEPLENGHRFVIRHFNITL